MSETSSSIIDKSTIKKGPNATWEKEQRPARWDDLLASRLGTFYRGRSTSASGFMEFDYFDSVHSGISRILPCVARRAPGPFATGSAASLVLVVAR